jgi:transposase
MTQQQNTSILRVMHAVCCGLDVHKELINACLITTDENGQEEIEFIVFQTFTDDLCRLRDWLLDHNCPIVAMESTGIYWRPVHNILEGLFEVILVNARHFKNLPGKKTDMSDCQWICGLMRVGLLKGSFIPQKYVRQWRDLTRYRRSKTQDLGDVKRQVHKLFESANIKIDSVVSQLFGCSGRNLMKLFLEKRRELTLEDVKKCLKGTLKSKAEELYRAVQGFFEEHHRWLLEKMLAHADHLEHLINDIQVRLRGLLEAHEDVLEGLMEIPGISFISAYGIISETGPTLSSFPNTASLCSWAGVCPGNNESAGKRHSGRSPVRRGNLKTILIEVAWAAIRAKGSYFRAKFFSLRSRLGPKKAIMAIAHRILKAIYHVIKLGEKFKDLGEDYLSDLHKKSKINYLIRQAGKFGYMLTPCPIIEK